MTALHFRSKLMKHLSIVTFVSSVGPKADKSGSETQGKLSLSVLDH